MPAIMVLLLPLPWLQAVAVSSLVHELCHCTAVHLAGGKVTGLWIHADGAVLETTDMMPIQSAVCSLAGPLGALLLLPLARWMPRTALCALIQSAYHLLPVYPLDGGRAFRSLTSHFNWCDQSCLFVETAVMITLGLSGIYLAVVSGLGLLPVCFAFALIFRVCREKYLANRRGKGYNIPTNS